MLLQSRLKRAVTCVSFHHARSGVNLHNHDGARISLNWLAILIRRSVSSQRRSIMYIPCNLAPLSVLSDFLSSCWTCTVPFDLELFSRHRVTILFGRQVALSTSWAALYPCNIIASLYLPTPAFAVTRTSRRKHLFFKIFIPLHGESVFLKGIALMSGALLFSNSLRLEGYVWCGLTTFRCCKHGFFDV